jgi:hypothetical protein
MLGVFSNQVSDIATESLTGVVGLIGNFIALFAMTWNPTKPELRPWLKFEIINIANERY